MNQLSRLVVTCGLAAALAGCGAAKVAEPERGASVTRRPPLSEAALDIVASQDRSDDDRRLDPSRRPVELLSFLGLRPAARVAELGAGAGYLAELLARTVGPNGAVYGQNSAWVLARSAERPWSERLQKPVMKNVVRLDRPFDDPLPPNVHDLDMVLCALFYHDLFWMGVDRNKLLRSARAALRQGGTFVVIDHSGRPGTGASEAETLHRIEETLVRAEIERAGFRLRAVGTFLRNPEDARDWNTAPTAAGDKRGTSDRFVLAYEKP